MTLIRLGLSFRSSIAPVNIISKLREPSSRSLNVSIWSKFSNQVATPIISKRFNSQIQRHIPGESEVADSSLSSRLPKFPFKKETVPTLLPKPGVPQIDANTTFTKMVHILKSKTEPELIYESEPHRLYFVACYCLAFVLAVYGVVFLEWSTTTAVKLYYSNEQKLEDNENLLMLLGRIGVNLLLFAIPSTIALLIFAAPTKLVRKIYYLPGPIEHVRFTSYSLFPGRPTPVFTVPLANINRHPKAKIWTGRGFYGTIDNSSFAFFLKEKSHILPWIVDRKGFFWGDGRVHDLLFGKESLAEAERGLTYDQKIGYVNRNVKREKEKLKKELGFGWQFKAQAKLAAEDLKNIADKMKAKGLASSAEKKSLPKSKESGKTKKKNSRK